MKRNLMKTFLLTVVMAMPLAGHSQNGYEIHKKNGEIEKIQYSLIDSIVCKQEAATPIVIDTIEIKADMGQVVCTNQARPTQLYSCALVEKAMFLNMYNDAKTRMGYYYDIPLATQDYLNDYPYYAQGDVSINYTAKDVLKHRWNFFAFYPGTSYYYICNEVDEKDGAFVGKPIVKEFRIPLVKYSDKQFTFAYDEPLSTQSRLLCTPPEGTIYYWITMFDKSTYDMYTQYYDNEVLSETFRVLLTPQTCPVTISPNFSAGVTYTLIVMGLDEDYLPIYQTYEIAIPGAAAKRSVMAPVSKENLIKAMINPLPSKNDVNFHKPELKTNLNLK